MRIETLWIALGLLCSLIVTLATLREANAQGYIERKDGDAAAVIERALAQVAKDPALFDGAAIPAGADLKRVGELHDQLQRQLDVMRRSYNDISDGGRRKPAIARLVQQLGELERYAQALAPVYRAAASTAQRAAADKQVQDASAKRAGIATCKAFRDEVRAVDAHELRRVELLASLATGDSGYWSTVEDGAKHKATIERMTRLCARPEYGDLASACGYLRGDEATWCEIPKHGAELMKRSVMNLATFRAEHFRPTRHAGNLEHNEGWLDIEGSTTWAAYFSGDTQRALYQKELAPLLEQAGIRDLDQLDVFIKLKAHFAALEAKVKEMAPTWKITEPACSGVACAPAKRTASAYGTVLRLVQRKTTWKIVKNDLGIPTHRYKDGFALLRVKGDPLCQLRSWTVTETFDGRRYQAASEAEIGYVRWQPCK